MADLVGKSLGRYEIVGRIGAGGMGEVYRARDTQLGRFVAIKVISAKVAQSSRAIERFEREAKTVARLSHPNIVDIHDFGRDDGIVYAVTELLEGNDLRDRIRGGFLPLSTVLKIGTDVAQGLAAAHSKGIIHRDIKPENVFVTKDGHVKILDFGLAGLKAGLPSQTASEAETESLTLTGDLLGTMGYLSPEQLRGEKPTAKSDIFSLGCLLYELLTGRRAFRGETAQDTALAILNRDPDPVAGFRTDVPPGYEAVVRRCLEKQPDERFESARDVAFALQAISDGRRTPTNGIVDPPPPRRRHWVVAAVASVVVLSLVAVAGWRWISGPIELPTQKHLAVLSFDVSSNDSELQQIADGVADAIADSLAVIERATHGSIWTIRPQLARDWGIGTLDQMHRTFNISLAVSGRMERHGESKILTMDLEDPERNRTIRSETIRVEPGNLASLQIEPVLSLLEVLEIEVDEATQESLFADTTNVVGALEPYLRGRGILRSATAIDQIELAKGLFENSAEADPLFDAPKLGVARAHLRKFDLNHDQEEIEAGIRTIEPILAHGRRVAVARRLLASLHQAAGRLDQAAQNLEEAIELEPFNAELHVDLAFVQQEAGLIDEAEDALNHAIYLRAGYWPDRYWLAVLYLGQGRYDAAAIQFRRIIQAAPNHVGGYNNLGGVYFFLGRLDDAQQLFEQSLTINSDSNYAAFSNLGSIYFDSSRFADSQKMFERAIAIDDSDYEVWGNLGASYLAGHEPERSVEPFDRAIDLAEELLPGDAYLLSNIATYYTALGDTESGLRYLDQAAQLGSDDPTVIANIAEAYEDLGDRENALEWVRRAVEVGTKSSRFEDSPSLRNLVADDRYRELFNESIN